MPTTVSYEYTETTATFIINSDGVEVTRFSYDSVTQMVTAAPRLVAVRTLPVFTNGVQSLQHWWISLFSSKYPAPSVQPHVIYSQKIDSLPQLKLSGTIGALSFEFKYAAGSVTLSARAGAIVDWYSFRDYLALLVMFTELCAAATP